MGAFKERKVILDEIDQMVTDWTQFVDADNLVQNMVLSYILASKDDICDCVQEKMQGAFYVQKGTPKVRKR